MKRIRRKLRKRKRSINRRLAAARKRTDSGTPVLSSRTITYEMGERVRAIEHGGIGAAHQVVVQSGLIEEIDENLELLKIHRPYHESDHVLNIAYNVLCGGRTLEDIELLRQDEVHLDALGTEAIPDPTTAGDFCRRFDAEHIDILMDAINEARLKVWGEQKPEFFEKTARIDADGSLVETTGECKQGMALNHKGIWGYHPLLISLANTKEPLFIYNRSGNRPSNEGAAHYLDKAIELCRRGGFEDILLRGDTDFAQTQHLDRWDDDGVRFVFGYKAYPNMKDKAADFDKDQWAELHRKADEAFDNASQRSKQPRVKEQIVRDKGYKNIRLDSEELAEFDYSPTACKKSYRVVVLKKNLTIERGEQALIDDDPLLLLHYERSPDDGRRSGLRVERALRSGEPHRAAQKRGACAACASQHPPRQRGLYGHGVVGLDYQGVDGVIVACLAEMEEQTRSRAQSVVDHGVSHLLERSHQRARPDCRNQQATGVPIFGVATSTAGIFSSDQGLRWSTGFGVTSGHEPRPQLNPKPLP